MAGARRDADAHRDVHPRLVDPDRPALDGGLDADEEGLGLVVVLDAVEHDHELVAAGAGHQVDGPHRVGQPVGDLGEHHVAGVVAEARR